jgi:hypothetical protein
MARMVFGEHHPGSQPNSRLGLAWPTETHGSWVVGSPWVSLQSLATQKLGKEKKKKKSVACVRERAMGVNLVFCSYFLKMQ